MARPETVAGGVVMGLGVGLWRVLPPWDDFSLANAFVSYGLAILGAGLVRDLALKFLERAGRAATPPPAEKGTLCVESLVGASLVATGLLFMLAGTRPYVVPGGLVVLLMGAGVLTSGLVAPYVVTLTKDTSHSLAC